MADVLQRMSIEALVSRARSTKGRQLELIDDRESGLRIRAGERSITWLLCVRLKNGKRSRIKLGVWPAMSAADARRAARAQKVDIAHGVDPNANNRSAALQAKTEALSKRTLRQALDRYEAEQLAHHRRGLETRRALDGRRGVLRNLAQSDLKSISRGDIAEAVRVHAKDAPIAANRGLAYANAFFNWCVNEELLGQNPAERVKKPAKEKQRDRYHSISELREIWQAAEVLDYPFGPLFQLLIALPMRRDEISAMPLVELALGAATRPEDGVWTLPADRTKRANALRVPLSPLAGSLIAKALKDPVRAISSPYVFSMTGDTPVSGFSKAKRRLDAVIEARRAAIAEQQSEFPLSMPHWTIHDLRTTFNTHACEILGVDAAVADRILNHVATATTSKVMRIYNKSELFQPRKAALNEWANFLQRECIDWEEPRLPI
jgi:integrase